MSIELDPQEVLEHLYSLGYYNITKEQLKEFIKDLKKLIKYDLRKEERKNRLTHENLPNSNKENVCTCSVSSPTKDKSSFNTVTVSSLKDSNLKKDSPCRSCYPPSHSNLYSRSKYDSSAEVQNKPCLSRALTSGTEPSCKCNCFLERGSGFSKKLCPHIGDGETEEASSSEEYSNPCSQHVQPTKKESCTSIKKTVNSLKPCPSFIRPGSKKPKPSKADPVALYHYYKSLWSQHNLPGENSHEDLRWRIRHRMMTPPVKKQKCTFDEDANSYEMKRFFKKKENRETRNQKCGCIFVKKICKNCIKNAPEKRILKYLKSMEIKFNLSSNKENRYCQ